MDDFYNEWWTAIDLGDVDAIKRLLSRDAFYLNLDDRFGKTGLMRSSYTGQEEVVSVLLEAGANVHLKDDSGHTALILASSQNHIRISQLLLLTGADINKADLIGITPLMHASNSGNEDLVKLLLQAGSSVHLQDLLGRTSLFFAFAGNHNSTGEMLLDFGANINELFIRKNDYAKLFSECYVQNIIEKRLNELSFENLVLWKKHRLRSILID